jgi:cytochrome P450
MTATEPSPEIEDWAADFDILAPGYVAEPAPVWAELREGCPIAHTDRYGATWLPTRYDDLTAIAHNVDRFSSRDIAVITPGRALNSEATMRLVAPPITSDPPVHTWARRMLLPQFSPRAIDQLAPITHELTDELIDAFIDAGHADAAGDYAQHIPVRVIARMLGVPLEDEEMFTGWAVTVLQNGFHNIQGAVDAVVEIIEYFGAKLHGRERMRPEDRPDDLITMLVDARHDGDPLDERHRIGSCFLLLLAGIDTTWSSIGSSLYHLATHPGDQQRLRDEPHLMTSAIEEFLRFYSPVTMARYVTEDTEFAGCPMKRGDKILMAFPAGNRDPEHFDEPDEFVIDRQRNRHFAFGSGIHRCLGSNLARMELRVALERFLDRIPMFELADPGAVTWSGGQVRGPRRVPVHW